MTVQTTPSAFETPDVANLVANGVTFRAYVWREITTPSTDASRILCSIYSEQEQGQLVHHSTHVIATSAADHKVFLPTILASSTYFVVHWVDVDITSVETQIGVLFRSTLDMSTYNVTQTWNNRGSVAMEDDFLYDASAAEDSSGLGNFFVVRKVSATEITLLRSHATGLDWVDTTWSSVITQAVDSCLIVYAHSGDADVMVAYGNGTALQTLRRNYTDGAVGTHVGGSVFSTAFAGDVGGEFTAVGICRVGTNVAAVVAEYAHGAYQPGGATEYLSHTPWVGYAAVNTDTAVRTGNDHSVPNLTLLSRPWAYPASAVGAFHVYAAVGYKTLPGSDNERGWEQALAFVVDFDRLSWGNTANTVRPWAVANLKGGPVYDTRPVGLQNNSNNGAVWVDGRRMNHLSHVSGPRTTGAEIKTRVVANIVFMRNQQVTMPAVSGGVTGFQPATSHVLGTRVHMEDPWVVSRDTLIGTSPPSTVFKGVGQLSPYQHVHVGRGLVIGGGMPSVYDGRQVVELNYPWAPELLWDSTTQANGAGLVASGRYQYVVVPEWRDSKGQLHRGPPSKPFEPTLAEVALSYMSATITCLTKADMVDGDHVSIRDHGDTYYTFWIDKSGTFVPGGGYTATEIRVLISGLAAGDNIAPTLDGVIETSGLTVSSSNAGGTVTVTLDVPGVHANADVNNHVADPDFAVSQFTGGMGTLQQITLRIRAQNLSLKDNATHYPVPGSDIMFIVYRTVWDAANETFLAGGAFFRLFGAGFPLHTGGASNTYWVGNAPKNSPRAASISFSDNQPDSNLYRVVDGKVIATEMLGYALDAAGNWTPPEPVAPPAFSVMALWRNRVWGATKWGEIWYSDEVLPEPGGLQYVVPEFHDGNRYRVDGIGDVTAMQAMDDALIVFTRDRIYALIGEGNDLSGTGATLQLEVLAEGTGCIEPRSVVLAPPGIFFQSAKGYYLLNRAKELDYSPMTGASIQDELDKGGNIRAAVMLEDEPVILVATNGGVTNAPRTLAYNYYRRRWSTWEHQPLDATAWSASMAGACVWRGHDGESCHVIAQQGAVAYQRAKTDATPFADQDVNGTAVPVRLRLSLDWAHLAGVAGATLLWQLGVQMEKLQPSAVHFNLDYDWTGTYDDVSPDATEEQERGEPRAATGWVRCVGKADYVSPGGEYVQVDDGSNPAVKFWFDVSGTFVPGGGYDATNIRVNISSDNNALSVAHRLRDAINSVGAGLAVTALVTATNGRVDLTNDATGTAGNVPLVETVAHPGFAVYGMSGGENLGAKDYIELVPKKQHITAWRLDIFEESDVPATENLTVTSITAHYAVEQRPRSVGRDQRGLKAS